MNYSAPDKVVYEYGLVSLTILSFDDEDAA